MLKLVSTALVGASLLVASPALAEHGASVSTAGLDLSSAHGRAELDKRLLKAANRLCDMGSSGLNMQMAFTTCRSEVLAAAQGQVTQLAARKGDGRIQLARAR